MDRSSETPVRVRTMRLHLITLHWAMIIPHLWKAAIPRRRRRKPPVAEPRPPRTRPNRQGLRETKTIKRRSRPDSRSSASSSNRNPSHNHSSNKLACMIWRQSGRPIGCKVIRRKSPTRKLAINSSSHRSNSRRAPRTSWRRAGSRKTPRSARARVRRGTSSLASGSSRRFQARTCRARR